jgi:hypothetical protein
MIEETSHLTKVERPRRRPASIMLSTEQVARKTTAVRRIPGTCQYKEKYL